MKVPKTIRAACQVLRSRVLYGRAVLRLPGHDISQDDTELIRAATSLYVKSWILPLLDALETGDLHELDKMIQGEPRVEKQTVQQKTTPSYTPGWTDNIGHYNAPESTCCRAGVVYYDRDNVRFVPWTGQLLGELDILRCHSCNNELQRPSTSTTKGRTID
jgi:hypothetical protein